MSFVLVASSPGVAKNPLAPAELSTLVEKNASVSSYSGLRFRAIYPFFITANVDIHSSQLTTVLFIDFFSKEDGGCTLSLAVRRSQ